VHLLSRQSARGEALAQLGDEIGPSLQEDLRLLGRRTRRRELGSGEGRQQKRSGHDE
jgi:hypothetical protein